MSNDGRVLLAPVRLFWIALLVALVAAIVAMLVYQHNPGWMYDAKVYRRGGAAVLHGQDVYSSKLWPAFTYTPFAALAFSALSFLSVNAIGLIWTTVSFACLEAVIWLCLGQVGVRARRTRLAMTAPVCMLAIWLDPISLTLLLGQVNIILMLIVLVDLGLPDGNRWKGIGVGAAAGIKLLPAFFILYLLLTRRLRATALSIAALTATAAVGFAGLGAGSVKYWGGTVFDSSRVGDPQNVRSQSLLSVLVRWTHTSHGVAPAWIALGAVAAVAALYLAVWAHRRGEELLAICLCGTGTLLISPITWQHHWVWVVPMLLWLAGRAWLNRSGVLWGAVAVIAIEFYVRPYQWGVPVDRAADLHLTISQLVLSSTYAVTAIILLAIPALLLWRERRAAAAPP